jgi:Carbohydrate-selective porin, OprB family
MTKLLSKNFLSPILIGIAVLTAGAYPVGANPTNNNQAPKPQRQTTNSLAAVNTEASAEQIEQAAQATEIKPGDWAYQTLQALSTKYDCANAPTGGKILSREEFATSLNSCVTSMEQLVARRKPRRAIKKRRPAPAPELAPEPTPEVLPPAPAPTPVAPPEPEVQAEEAVTQQDLDRLKQLVQSFGTELQSLDARIEALDKKTADLKAQSFSTTTKLNGEVIFSLSGYGGRGTGVGANPTSNTILGDRIRLNFDTSFTGKDLLRTRLQTRNLTAFNSGVTGSNMTRLGYDGGDLVTPGTATTYNNSTGVSLLKYNFPISPETKIITEVIGAEFNDEYYNFNPALESSGNGALSRFGRFNPVYRLSNDGAHVGVDHKFSKELGLALAYGAPIANSASNPAQGANSGGIFNGSNVFFGQVRISPSEDLNLGLVYAHSFHTNGSNLAGGTVSGIPAVAAAPGVVATPANPGADNPFGSTPTSANHYSFLASYKVSPNFVLSGWAGFTEAIREAAGGGNASSSNYAVTLAFPDFGQKGNSLAFVLGIPPKLNSRSGPTGTASAGSVNPNTSYHLEALYKVKLSDNLSITPGIIFITNPEHNSANPTEYVGSVRTTFKF